MAELGGEPLTEGDDRRPVSVQTLQHHGRAAGEQVDELVVAGLVGDAGTDATTGGEGRVGQCVAVFGHPQERRPQPSFGDQLVDRVGTQQIDEGATELVGRREQWRPAPVFGAELGPGTGDEARQGRRLGRDGADGARRVGSSGVLGVEHPA